MSLLFYMDTGFKILFSTLSIASSTFSSGSIVTTMPTPKGLSVL